MSAWRIGAEATQRRVSRTFTFSVPGAVIAGAAPGADVVATGEVQQTDTQATAGLVQKAADVYTKWLPGDVLAVFIALTAAFRGTLDADEGPLTPHAWGILIAGLALAAGITLLGCNCGEP